MAEMNRKRERERSNGRGLDFHRVDNLFNLVDRNGGDWARAREEMDSEISYGEDSERMVEEVLKGMPEVRYVRKTDEFEDRIRRIDRYAEICGIRWGIQIKSSRKGCESALEIWRRRFNGKTGEELSRRMAVRGVMVINARMGENEEENRMRIEDQVRWWVGLREKYLR